MPRASRPLATLALVALSGLVWGAAFAARPFLPLSFVALVPLLLTLGRFRHPFLLGWWHGVLFWGSSMVWILGTLTTYGQLSGWLAGLSLLLMSLFLGSYTALFAGLGAMLWRSGGWRAVLGLPALWLVLEVARGHLFTGFPWNLAAYAWTRLPGALPLAAWIGAWGVSFLVLFVNVAVARGVAAKRWEGAAAALLTALLLLAAGGRWGAGEPATNPGHTAVIVQPDTPNQVGFDPRVFEKDYARLIAMSTAACEEGALLLWPESAAWPLSYERDPRLAADIARLTARGCSVLFNSSRLAGGRSYNAMMLADEDGSMASYDKRHLVPFGEYVPLSGIFTFIPSIARNAGDFSPATDLHLLPWQGEELGPAVCYEVVFPGEVAEGVRAGATFLVSVTNDAWYGDTAAPWQHLAAARFRAAENRRYLLRAAITGVSAAIAPDGSLAGSLGVGERGTIRVQVEGSREFSPFSRAPFAVPLLAALLLAAAGLAAQRARRSATPSD
ncbi:MAG: apolipoprotein N-acyltransferase [Thermoanaerobaculia bacterium]